VIERKRSALGPVGGYKVSDYVGRFYGLQAHLYKPKLLGTIVRCEDLGNNLRIWLLNLLPKACTAECTHNLKSDTRRYYSEGTVS
jgi:hypothetical protein